MVQYIKYLQLLFRTDDDLVAVVSGGRGWRSEDFAANWRMVVQWEMASIYYRYRHHWRAVPATNINVKSINEIGYKIPLIDSLT